MARKKTVVPDPSLVKLRDVLAEVLAHVESGKKQAAALCVLRTIEAIVGLTEKYGEDLQGVVVPDGFLDVLDNRARLIALVGILAYARDKAQEQ